MASSAAFAQTNLIQNGSFENGSIYRWTVRYVWAGPTYTGTGDGGVNVATQPGIENKTSTPGANASDGTQLLLGSATLGTGTGYATVIYQDVTIPADATTGTLSADVGLKYVNGMSTDHAAGILLGIFPTSGDPRVGDAPILPKMAVTHSSSGSETALSATSLSNINLAPLAGTTVRVALQIQALASPGSVVGMIDNVRFVVNGTPAPPTATPVPPTMVLTLLGLGGSAAAALRRRRPQAS